MAEIKLNTDKKLSKETIEKHKDFNGFIKGYKEFYGNRSYRNIYRKRRLFTIVIVIIILILILLFDKLGK